MMAATVVMALVSLASGKKQADSILVQLSTACASSFALTWFFDLNLKIVTGALFVLVTCIASGSYASKALRVNMLQLTVTITLFTSSVLCSTLFNLTGIANKVYWLAITISYLASIVEIVRAVTLPAPMQVTKNPYDLMEKPAFRARILPPSPSAPSLPSADPIDIAIRDCIRRAFLD